jgi:hypothetical protein
MAALVGALLGILSTLLGAVVVHILTAAREHKKWLLDQEKAEYRELIDQLYDTITVVLEHKSKWDSNTESRETFNAAVKKLARMFEDRIFIAKDVENKGIKKEWLELKKVIHANPEDREILPKEFWYSDYNIQVREDKLRKRLVEAANEAIVTTKLF